MNTIVMLTAHHPSLEVVYASQQRVECRKVWTDTSITPTVFFQLFIFVLAVLFKYRRTGSMMIVRYGTTTGTYYLTLPVPYGSYNHHTGRVLLVFSLVPSLSGVGWKLR